MKRGKITVAPAATFQLVRRETLSDAVELDDMFSSFARPENKIPML